MGIVAAGRGQHVMVVCGVGDLAADIDLLPIDRSYGSSVDQAVDEGGVGVLENLLDRTRKLVGRLRPVVVFHGDHEDRLDRTVIVRAVIVRTSLSLD